MKRTILRIVDYTVAISEPERIILFGSMSNDSANSFSDIDLLVISEDLFIKRYIKTSVTSYSNELSIKADVLVYSESEIEREREKPNSFITAAIISGQVVYEKLA